MDTSNTLPGERNRAVADPVENSQESEGNGRKRRSVGDLLLASAGGEEVVTPHAQRWHPESKERRVASRACGAGK